MNHRYETDAQGRLLHYTGEELRAVVEGANVNAYIVGLDFDGQIGYQRVQQQLEQKRKDAEAKAAAAAAAAQKQLDDAVARAVAAALAAAGVTPAAAAV